MATWRSIDLPEVMTASGKTRILLANCGTTSNVKKMRRRNGPAARLLKFLANRSLKVELKRDELHIWTIDCDAARHTMASADRFLSAAEKDRAARFRFDLHRDRYVVAHVAMRSILGAYLDRNPHDLTFAVEGNGKPVLVLESDSIPLRFNLSHSHNAALIAVTRDQIGR